MGNKTQRQTQLIEIIKEKGLLPVKTLSSMLGVSEMTIRRDLRTMQHTQVDSATIQDFSLDVSFDEQEYDLLTAFQQSNEQKNKIGEFAASLIQKNDVLIIDTGSTTDKMLPYIPNNMNLTILCYNANILSYLTKQTDVKLLFAGGVYHRNTEMFESPEGLQFIERTRANKVFISAAGIHKDLGITCSNNYEITTKIAVMKSSQEKILVADSTKFGRLCSSYFCSLSDIDTIITDSNLTEEWKEHITKLGITLHLV